MYAVKQIIKVEPYQLILKFNNGETRMVDLGQKLMQWSQTKNSIYRQLLNPTYFMSVKMMTDWDTVCWDNGIDFCPDTLYSWGYTLKRIN